MNTGSRYIKSPIIRITQESPDQNCAQTATTTTTSDLTATYSEKTGTMSFATTRTIVDSNVQHQGPQEPDDEKISIDINKTISTPNTSVGQGNKNDEEKTHVYRKRFFILALFCCFSAINSFQWIEYSSITNVVTSYYGATNLQVNMTSLIYMLTYIPFIIHASLMLERFGLKKAIVLGTFGTALGSLIKWQLGNAPGMVSFWWMMSGQTIVALSQLYIISIPPLLAAVWFPDSQVSTATGIGVFGNQLGIALGFIIPPLIISNVSAPKETIGNDMNNLAGVVFGISLLIFMLSVVTLEDRPPKPPGSASLHAALQQQNDQNSARTYTPIKELCKNRDFFFLILSYGINVGVFYAVSTVLNQMVMSRFPKLDDLAGTMGLLLVVSGMVGSVLCGQWLDRTHAFKFIIVLIYTFSLLSMLLFTWILQTSDQVWYFHAVAIIVGFFTTGYLPLGFEFAAEITYPHPANTPAGLLNLSAQVFGLILTVASSLIVDGERGDLWANLFLSLCLGVGLVLTVAMKADLKRQKAVAEEQMILMR